MHCFDKVASKELIPPTKVKKSKNEVLMPGKITSLPTFLFAIGKLKPSFTSGTIGQNLKVTQNGLVRQMASPYHLS